jgi:peroxiredoxin
MSDFGARGAQVFGISVDSTWSHGVYRKQLNLPDELELLSDFNRDFGRAYGILTTTASGFKDVLKRTVFIVRPDGKISYRWDSPDPPGLPRADDVLAALGD